MITIKYAKGEKKGETLCVLETRKEFVNMVLSLMSSMAVVNNIDKNEYLGKYGFKCIGETNGHSQYSNPDAFITCLHYLMDNGDYYVEVTPPMK